VRILSLIAMALLIMGGCGSEERKATGGSSATPAVAHSDATAKNGEDAPSGHTHEEGESAPHGHDEGEPHTHAHDETAGPLVPLTPIERENIGLKTVPAALQPLEDVRRFPGVIKPHPDRVAFVTSRTAGKIVEIHTEIGARVTKGQDVIEVQSVEVEKLELDLMQAESKYQAERAKLELDLAQAQNKLRLAQAEADRNRALVEKGVGARKELLAAENELKAVTNEIAGLKRQIQLLAQASQNEIAGLTRQLGLLGLPANAIERVRREKSTTLLHIPAPLGGVIVERPVSLGQVIETTTTLFRIIDDSIIIAEGDAFEDQLSALRVGQRVRLMVAAYPKRVFEGTLTFIHPVIDPEKRTAHIWVQLSNPDGELKLDMFAQLAVVVGGGSPVVTIPADAVMAAEGAVFVFVERDGGFARVEIATGARNDQFIEVKRGLHAGDRVVTDGKRQVYTKLLAMRSGGAALGGHTH
jgi:membrane fusion protein, heavy metal efflux system